MKHDLENPTDFKYINIYQPYIKAIYIILIILNVILFLITATFYFWIDQLAEAK